MKKLSMLLMAGTLFCFISCGETKKAEGSAETETVVEEVVVEESSSSASVDKYLDILDKMYPLMDKVAAGDMAVMEEYQKLATEMGEIAQSEDFVKEMQNMSAEQMAKYQAAMEKYQAASQKMAGGQ